MRLWARLTLFTCAVLAATGATFGSGYNIFEQGAKASGEAGAFAARADDPSAIYYNPAGVVGLEGMNIAVGGSAIFLGDTQFTSAATGKTYDMENNVEFPPHIFFTQKLNPTVAWGIGIFSNWGLRTEWNSNFEGRDIARLSRLTSYTVSPVISFVIHPGWSGAIGVDYSHASVRLTKNIDFGPFGEGFSSVKGDGGGWGANVALRYKSPGPFRFGLTWRTRQKISIDGADATFSDIPPFIQNLCRLDIPAAGLERGGTRVGAGTVPPGGGPCFPDGKASSELEFPQNAAMGFGWSFKELDFEADLSWIRWKDFQTLDINFDTNTPLLDDQRIQEDWTNSYAYRLGFGWRVGEHQELRAGYYHETNPIPDKSLRPTLPDSARDSVQIGYGYTKGAWGLDGYVQEIVFEDNTTTNQSDGLDGTYQSRVTLAGVTFHVHF